MHCIPQVVILANPSSFLLFPHHTITKGVQRVPQRETDLKFIICLSEAIFMEDFLQTSFIIAVI